MTSPTTQWHAPKFWIGLIAAIVVLIFLYFYRPFEEYIIASIPNIRFHNVIFWFASLVGVIVYVTAHWQAFRQHIVTSAHDLKVTDLVFDTLQVALMTAVIFSAGATLQAVVMLGEHMMSIGPMFGGGFGAKLLAIILLIILTLLFYLLHYAVRGFRGGWSPRRPPRRVASD